MRETPHPQAARDGADAVLSFSEFLAAEADRQEGLTKGERTRRRIKAAAARILETKGYHALQMADVAKTAGLSHGAVYKYFQNKKHVTLEVLSECVERSIRLMLPDKLETNAYERIYQATLKQVHLFVANVGLTRCIRQLGDELPEFNELVLRANAEWYELVARGFVRRWRPPQTGMRLASDVAHTLGGMIDELMYDIFVRRNPKLEHYRNDPEGLAQLISILWYRAAYGENPESDRLDPVHPILALNLREAAATPFVRAALDDKEET